MNRLFAARRPSRWHWMGLIGLVGLLAWTIVRAGQGCSAISVWDLQNLDRVAAWAGELAGRVGLRLGVYLAAGLILPPVLRAFLAWACPPDPSPDEQLGERGGARRGFWRWIALVVAQVVLALAWVAGLAGLALGMIGLAALRTSWALALDMAVAGVGVGLGLWIGHGWRHGWSGRLRLVLQGLVAVGSVVLAVVSLPFLVLGERPHDVPLPAVTSADKRDLVELVRQQNTSESGFRVYRIDSASFDRLLDWSLTVEPLTGARARAELSDQSQYLRGSLPWPPGADNGVPQRFLNVTLSGQCEIVGEELLLDLCTLRIGAVQLPERAARWLGQAVAQWVNRDPSNAELLTGVVAVRADRQGVDVVLSDDGLRRRRMAHLMRRLGDQPDVAPEVRIQLAAMARIVREANRTDPLFETAVRSAFQLARDRSRSRDPIHENRAAILALGIALGHVGLEMYVGDAMDKDTGAMVVQLLRRSRLRDRADWSRHFWVSAAVTLLAGDRISDVVGLLKEELDAGPSGSGFSFSDLMADRAGTEFAQAATRDAPSARAIQKWVLADDTDLQWLMPAADDLPEGLTDTDMDALFDGVGGVRFRQMLDEIQRRLDELPWRR